ncbi:CAF17-like 4Fe-4S cluster assembly/insertion protein YgfZ [Humisphaera borealis]|uniref:Aminomethyl transferase family protein n=1 Tax=Humisphaera borealis TaxID=2807512 RepID=A0A7M2WWL8_9BACT|nr:aminomethyltransferase family protein [Humisphaera borealis]QOV89927.1 aminomethyl transferase family protein [Humisphaera borealis]
MTEPLPQTPPADPAPPPETRSLPNPLHALHVAVEAEFQPYETVEIVSTFGEPQAEYAALHKSCGLMDLAHRGVLELTGKDRLTFLNNLLSNQTWSKETKTGMPAGMGVYAFLLQTNGRVLADMNVIERGDRTLLETDARLIVPLRQALDRYLFTEQVKLFDRVGHYHELALHGPTAREVLSAAAGVEIPELTAIGSTEITLFDVPVVVWRDDVCGTTGLHLIIPIDRVEAVWKTLVERFGQLVAHAKRPLRPIGWAAFNAVRIEAGRPLFGIDFDSTILPAETGVETFTRAVNVYKGCYVGQEIVARMFARKQSAKSLVGLKLVGETLPIAGSPVFDDAGNQVGGITSSTVSPLQSRSAICFALVKKLFAADGKVVQAPAEGALRPATVSTSLRFLEKAPVPEKEKD